MLSSKVILVTGVCGLLGMQFGSVDACVNAAYPRTASWGTPFENLEMEDLQENLKLQLGGAIILSQWMMKYFVAQ